METTTTAGQPEGPPGCCQGMSPPVIAIAGPQGLDASSASQWPSMTALVKGPPIRWVHGHSSPTPSPSLAALLACT